MPSHRSNRLQILCHKILQQAALTLSIKASFFGHLVHITFNTSIHSVFLWHLIHTTPYTSYRKTVWLHSKYSSL